MILIRMQESASRNPDKIAVRMKAGDRYQQHTYHDLVRGVASVAGSLSEHGVGRGDRIAILSENRPEWMMAYLAVLAHGAVIVPLDAQLTDKEVALLLSDSGAKAIFVSEACRQKLPGNSSLIVITFDPGTTGVPFHEMLTAHHDVAIPPAPPPGELAAILYTSGTTGDPKGVMLSQGNLASNLESVIRLDLVDQADNFLLLLPLHHTYPAMACILLPFAVGATVTILNSLKGPDILNCLQETGITILVGVPLLFNGLRKAIFEEIRKKPAPIRLLVGMFLGINGMLLRTVGMNIGKTLFGAVHARFGPRFRLFASGGARLEPDVYTDMTRLGFTVIEGYGLTETSPVSAFNPLSKQKAGSIGIAVPDVEVRIENPDEHGMGEIAIRGPNVMLGYFKKPQETAEVLHDGWFLTGDLGYRDEDGYFFITGRSKEMIVLPTGKKIFPDELEKFYKQIPAIREICLIQGERGIEAAVVPDFDYLKRMNLSNSRETISFEIEDLAKDLPPYKRIAGLKIFKEPLPVTRLGKLKRSKVRELYQQGGERAATNGPEVDGALMADPVARKLLECLEPFSSKKKIHSDDNLELDLGLDSLSRVEFVVNLEKAFGVSLPDSFGSAVFTVKDAVQKTKELIASGTFKAGERGRSSWAEILSQEPGDDARGMIQLESGPITKVVRYTVMLLLTAIMKVYGRLSARGLENLPGKGPYIIAPNHLSFADVPSIAAAVSWKTGSQVFFLGATAFFGGPITSRLARIFHVIPVDMDTRLHNALQLSAAVLRRGQILLVFPEGSRSRDGSIKEFKKGVGIIAKELNIPIVPVAISGTYAMMPAGRLFPRPARVRVSFGNPIQPAGRDYDEIVKALYAEVVKMLEGRK